MPNHLTTVELHKPHRDGQLPAINLWFYRQGPGHCKNAYIKEFERKNYPDEYRVGGADFRATEWEMSLLKLLTAAGVRTHGHPEASTVRSILNYYIKT